MYMRAKDMITILLILVAQRLFAYLISPRPLRKLIIESEVIVYANVLRIKSVETKDHENNNKAVLALKELLQGKMPERKEVFP